VEPQNTPINWCPLTGEMNDNNRCSFWHDDEGDNEGTKNGVDGAWLPSSPLPPPPLMLVDLGSTDCYHPGKLYNVQVTSQHYKSPTLPGVGYILVELHRERPGDSYFAECGNGSTNLTTL
jgi:hypothetical protein